MLQHFQGYFHHDLLKELHQEHLLHLMNSHFLKVLKEALEELLQSPFLFAHHLPRWISLFLIYFYHQVHFTEVLKVGLLP
jgi:hypothetical protein